MAIIYPQFGNPAQPPGGNNPNMGGILKLAQALGIIKKGSDLMPEGWGDASAQNPGIGDWFAKILDQMAPPRGGR